jgi:mannose-6-phosphate isomerase-like protein (cupin superfamily)
LWPEEFIVVLEGQGSMIISGGRQLEMKAATALYCPPETEHDVKNTGPGRLRYVYIVAKARGAEER